MSKTGLPKFINNSPLERCDQILWLIKHSNLNFRAEETPFSLNVTIRKKFINRWAAYEEGVETEMPDDVTAKLLDEQKMLLEQLEQARLTIEAKDIKIADMSNRVHDLTNKLEISESKIEFAARDDSMAEAVSEEKRQLQIKHEKVCSDIKHLKQENADLRKDLGSTNVALKAARKQVQEESKKSEKDMLVLNTNVENLQHYKNLKIAEEKESRQKIKKVKKKLKQVTEKEAMIQVEKDQMARNMVKSKKVSSGSSSETDTKKHLDAFAINPEKAISNS